MHVIHRQKSDKEENERRKNGKKEDRITSGYKSGVSPILMGMHLSCIFCFQDKNVKRTVVSKRT